jgi:hypothetical protein
MYLYLCYFWSWSSKTMIIWNSAEN